MFWLSAFIEWAVWLRPLSGFVEHVWRVFELAEKAVRLSAWARAKRMLDWASWAIWLSTLSRLVWARKLRWAGIYVEQDLTVCLSRLIDLFEQEFWLSRNLRWARWARVDQKSDGRWFTLSTLSKDLAKIVMADVFTLSTLRLRFCQKWWQVKPNTGYWSRAQISEKPIT